MVQRVLLSLAVVCALAGTAQSQGNTTLITGQTVSSTGEVIGDVRIEFRDLEHGEVIENRSDERGNFAIEIPGGDYELTVSKDGFNTVVAEFTLPPGQELDQDIVLVPEGSEGEGELPSGGLVSPPEEVDESAPSFKIRIFDRRAEEAESGSLLIEIQSLAGKAVAEDPADSAVAESTASEPAAEPIEGESEITPRDPGPESASPESLPEASPETPPTSTEPPAELATAVPLGIVPARLIESIEIGLPKAFRNRATFHSAGADWSLSDKGRLVGDPATLLYLRFDYDGVVPPSKLDLILSWDETPPEGKKKARKTTESKRLSVDRIDPPTFEEAVEDQLVLPPIAVAGRPFIFTPLLTAPFDLRWSFGSSDNPAVPPSTPDDSTSEDAAKGASALVATLPLGSAPGQPVRVVATDPWGVEVALHDWFPQTLSQVPDSSLGIQSVSPWITQRGSGCVCGGVASVSDWAATTLGGKPLGMPTAASERVARWKTPKELPAGPVEWLLTPDPSATPSQPGFAPRSAALQVQGTMNSDALWNGESTPATFEVIGTQRPILMRLTNHTPEIISMDHGAVQLRATTGGERNEISDRVIARQVGNFNITYALNEGDCPCAPPDNRLSAADRHFSRTLELLNSDDPPPGPPPGPLTQQGDSLPLGNERFRVEIEWQESSPAQQVSGGTAAIDDSKIFYFFQAGQWRMLIDIVDACSEFDRFWVFHAATADLDYRLRVIDTESGIEKSYLPEGPWKSIADTEGLAACPPAPSP